MTDYKKFKPIWEKVFADKQFGKRVVQGLIENIDPDQLLALVAALDCIRPGAVTLVESMIGQYIAEEIIKSGEAELGE